MRGLIPSGRVIGVVVIAALAGIAAGGPMGGLTAALDVWFLGGAWEGLRRSEPGSRMRRVLRATLVFQMSLVGVGAAIGGWRWGWVVPAAGVVLGLALKRRRALSTARGSSRTRNL